MVDKSVAIITLGCKVNQYESDSIALELEKRGFSVVRGLEKASYYVLNTCAVTNEGERKSRGQIAKILKINPNAKIYVCGCASELNATNFQGRPNVCYITGVQGKMKIVNAIEGDLFGTNIEELSKEYDDSMQSKQTRTRAFIKIQDGCNSFCSYCIIPYLRGRSRSRSVESIKSELDQISSREVVFAGVDLSQYGNDLPGKPKLEDVIELMRGREARFRFSSLEMGTITPNVLKVLSTLSNFCPHFHLSMQSGCDSVLKRMNRKHMAADYEECVREIRKVFPNAAITTDVICGFPGETEEEAEKTFEFCKKINFFEMHIFPYSIRKGTVAASLPNQITGDVKKARVSKLEELAGTQKAAYIEKQIGTVAEVLVEKIDGHTAEGYSKNYVRTLVENCNKTVKIGDIILCKVSGANSDFAIAKYQK